MANGNDLTDAQKGVYKENDAALEEAEEHLRTAQQKAYARLKEVGIDGGDESCMRCGCPEYVATPHHPLANCPREFCGHSFASHHW